MWKTVPENEGRPGYLGKRREERYSEWDEKYGEGNWRLAWRYGDQYLTFLEACEVYEEAYFVYLRDNPAVLEELLSVASNVYDDAVTNVHSGCDYTHQETGRTHIQDISIRRVVRRLGRTFKGKKLIQIRHDRGLHPLSMTLSPGIVPFHWPGFIIKPYLTGWWAVGTVECFYQSNRILQVRR